MKIAIVGHSHINCIERAGQSLAGEFAGVATYLQLRDAAFAKSGSARARFAPPQIEGCNVALIEKAVVAATAGATLVVLCPVGNEHAALSLSNEPETDPAGLRERVRSRLANYRKWLAMLCNCIQSPAALLPPPPPVESEAHLRAHPGLFAQRFAEHGVAPAARRSQTWLYQVQMLREMATEFGLRFLELPATVFSDGRYLREDFLGNNPSHANPAYGELILRHIVEVAAKPGAAPAPAARRHPYEGLPDRAFWKQAVAQVPLAQFDPVGEVPFRISRAHKVATAGSCFAQHISKRIRAAGFQFLVTEAPAGIGAGDAQARGFHDFTARYGNLYTARQLLQLFERAYGAFSPVDSYWPLPGGRYCDPFRPRIEPEGFASAEALEEDRARHLAAVRQMFEMLDVFVFTLGLTECWASKVDGAVFPLAPGVAGGEFDPAKYEFVNFGVNEVVSDLQSFIGRLRGVKAGAKVLLTVSPVPLVATYEAQHVLVATTYSKSVLRVAAETVCRSIEGVSYFPSYEIITGNYNRGRYFGPDLRSVTDEGVDHVMAVFMRHMTEAATTQDEAADEDRELMALAEAACDEELLERK